MRSDSVQAGLQAGRPGRSHVKRSSRIATALLLSLCGVSAVFSAERAVWHLRAAKLYVDPTTAPQQNVTVHIKDGRIIDVSARGASTRSESTCDGGIVTAGFNNSHVHFTGDEWANAATAPAEELSRSLEQMLTRYGFTTVFDAASNLAQTSALRRRIEKNEVRGPRILSVGAGLYPYRGLPYYLADLPAEVLARLPQPQTPAEAEATVRSNMQAGADATKLFVATPQSDGSIKRMAPEVIRAAVRATHDAGKLVAAHPTDIEGLRIAVEGGVDIILHTTYQERQPWPAELVARMSSAGTALTPTLQLWNYEGPRANIPESTNAELIERTMGQLRDFTTAGGLVLFGTDVGYMPEFDPTREYVYMSQAGLSHSQILAALTTTPARVFREQEQRGAVRAGMSADLVVLAVDPAADVRHFTNVKCTIRAGEVIYRRDAGQK